MSNKLVKFNSRPTSLKIDVKQQKRHKIVSEQGEELTASTMPSDLTA